MDVRQYKEKASEVATDLRYAAADSVTKAKEMGSFLSFKMADKLQELRQKVKESTGMANPGYVHNSSKYDQPNDRNYDQQDAYIQGQGYPGEQRQQQQQWLVQGQGDVLQAQQGSQAEYNPIPEQQGMQRGELEHIQSPESTEDAPSLEADMDYMQPAVRVELPAQPGSEGEEQGRF